MKNPSILISGAGIAGPTLAYWLLRYGFTPVLVERSPHLRTGGYIIDFWGTGYSVAERMGILPDLNREGYFAKEVRFVNARGEKTGGFPVEVLARSAKNRFVSLARGTLAAQVFRTIEGRAEVIFNDSIVSLHAQQDGVEVLFERSGRRSFDLVIGADGLHSVVRKLAFGREGQFEHYLGYMAAAFRAKGYQFRDELVYLSYSRPGKMISRFAMRDDTTLFFFIFADPQGKYAHLPDHSSHMAALHAAFDGHGWECAPIMKLLEAGKDLYFDRVSQIKMDTWSKGRIALLGDAAACPSLLAGEGSSLAMAAAYVLAGELAQAGGDYHRAFGRYEERLRPLIERKQRSAVRFAGSFAPKTQFGIWVRDMVTKSFAYPFVADVMLGAALKDDFSLPEY